MEHFCVSFKSWASENRPDPDTTHTFFSTQNSTLATEKGIFMKYRVVHKKHVLPRSDNKGNQFCQLVWVSYQWRYESGSQAKEIPVRDPLRNRIKKEKKKLAKIARIDSIKQTHEV
jgi:hypothetical protein